MEPTPASRICSIGGCEAQLRASNTIGRCREHAYVPVASAVCAADGCDQLLRKDNRTGYCTPHKRAKDRGPVPKRDLSGRVYGDRTCPDCGSVFTPASATQLRCQECRPERRRALKRKQEWAVCSVPDCGAKLRTSNTTGRCQEHRYIPVDRDVCAADGCVSPLRTDNAVGYCEDHRTAKSREPARPCGAPGCDRTLRTDNASGYCTDHAELGWRNPEYLARKRAVYHAQPKPPDTRRTCSVDGCERKLRSDNTSGRCVDHIYIPLNLPLCPVDGCRTRLKSNNTVGRCTEHRGSYWADDAPKCTVPGCGKTLHADNRSGLCKQHYDEAWKKRNSRAYYLRNQADLREYARQYREVYAEEHRAHASARRSAARSGLDSADLALSVAYRLAIRHDPCFYCGSPETAHVDHYFPIAKGGTEVWWNLVRSCERCNYAKRTKCGTAFLLSAPGG